MLRRRGSDEVEAGSSVGGDPSEDSVEPMVASGRDGQLANSAREDQILTELVRLGDLFESRLVYDETREQHFNRVYSELDAYKRDESVERMLGLARGLILILDKVRDQELPTEFVRGMIEEALAHEGIVPIAELDSRPGAEEVVGFLEATAESDRLVVGEGFALGERVVRPRRLLVRKAGE